MSAITVDGRQRSSSIAVLHGVGGEDCGWIIRGVLRPLCFLHTSRLAHTRFVMRKIWQKSRGESEGIHSMVKEGKVIEVPFMLRGHITSSINNQSIIKNVDLSYRFLHNLSRFTCRVWPWRIVRKWATVHLSILTMAAVLRKKKAPGGALRQRPRPALTFSPVRTPFTTE